MIPRIVRYREHLVILGVRQSTVKPESYAQANRCLRRHYLPASAAVPGRARRRSSQRMVHSTKSTARARRSRLSFARHPAGCPVMNLPTSPPTASFDHRVTLWAVQTPPPTQHLPEAPQSRRDPSFAVAVRVALDSSPVACSNSAFRHHSIRAGCACLPRG